MSDQIKFKDVAHLYFKCDVSGIWGRGILVGIDENGWCMVQWDKNFAAGDEDFYQHRKTTELNHIKPILRTLESMTDEEAQGCLVEVFLVPSHNAWMDVEALQQYLCNNTEYHLGIEDEDSLPLSAFAVTPQTYFNLTLWLLKKHFDLFGLIPTGQAISSDKK